MKIFHFLIIFFLKQIITIIPTIYADMDALMKEVEIDVINLRDLLESSYSTRCSLTDFNIKSCSYFACSSSYPTLQCKTEFNTTSCACSTKTGMMMFMEKSGIRMANFFEPYTNPLDKGVQEIVGSSSVLDDAFKQLSIEKPYYKFLYFGSINGISRSYPLRPTCTQFDSRVRPWYIGASSGTKNLIFILDTSGSMSGLRLTTLKESILVLINTLTSSDRIGLITFNSVATAYNDTLIRATNQNKLRITDLINSLNATGGSNFTDAFAKADFLISNTPIEFDTPCKTILFFITDGKPTEGIIEIDSLVYYIDNLPNLKNVTIFSYSVGTLLDTKIPEKISCIRKGIFEYVQDYTTFSDSFNSYFIAISFDIALSKPIWIEPYEDSNGLGQMTTAAIPVFDRSGSKPFLIGVLGIDVTINDLLKIEPMSVLMDKILKNNVYNCNLIINVLSTCQVNVLRRKHFQCGIPASELVVTNEDGCMIRTAVETCPNGFIFQVYCEQSSYQTSTQTNICCSPNICLALSNIKISLMIIIMCIIFYI